MESYYLQPWTVSYYNLKLLSVIRVSEEGSRLRVPQVRLKRASLIIKDANIGIGENLRNDLCWLEVTR